MTQIVVAEVEAFDPSIYGTRTLRFSTEGFSTGSAPLGDPLVDSRLSVVRAGTATRINGRGLVESVAANLARFDYDPITLALRGLLVEETRTNQVTYSEQCWDTAQWGVGSTLANFYTVTNSTDVANIYGGTAGVAKFVAAASTAVLFLRKTVTLAASTYAASIYIYVPAQSGVTNWSFVCDAADTEQSATATSTTFGRWVRIEAPAFTTAASRAFWDFNIFVNGATPSPGFTFYAMGAQIEAGAFHTSYIPTQAATVTRNIDRITMGGGNFTRGWYSATQGTLFAEASSFASTGNGRRFVEISDGTTNNRQLIDISPLGPNRVFAAAAGSTVLDGPDDTYTPGSVSRIAYAYATGNYAAVSNGRAPITSASAAVPSGQNIIAFGSNHDGTTTSGNALNGHLRRVIYWPTRLTNAQMQSMTLGQQVPTGMTLDMNFADGANVFYEGRISQPANVRRDCFRDGRTFGRGQIGFGDLELINNDGGLDYLLNYSFSGRRITIRLGTLQANGLTRTWTTILVGSMEQCELSWQRVNVRIRDRQLDIAKPLQQTRYAGGNVLPAGLEGNDNDLKGKPKPLVYGKVFNIQPPCVNTSRLIYQLHTGGQVVSVDAVYDRGVQMTAGAAYSSQADMEANTPTAGQYRVWNDATLGTFIRLGTNPTGTITADVTQGASRTVGQLFLAILARAGIATSDILTADVTALDAAVNYEVGVFAGVDREYTALELLDELCASVGAWYGTDAIGRFRIGRIEVPVGTSLGTLTTQEIVRIERVASRDAGVGVPAWKVKLGYQKVYTVQGDLEATVSAARKALVAEEYRREESFDENVKLANSLSPELEFATVLTTKANAAAEASRRLAIYKERRDVYNVTVRVTSSLASVLDLGNIITLQINRFGMSAGKKFLIIGVRTNMQGYQFELTLWG